jgi:hypothetical protein
VNTLAKLAAAQNLPLLMRALRFMMGVARIVSSSAILDQPGMKLVVGELLFVRTSERGTTIETFLTSQDNET